MPSNNTSDSKQMKCIQSMVTPAFRPTPVYMTMTGLHNIAPKYHEGTQDVKGNSKTTPHLLWQWFTCVLCEPCAAKAQ